MVNIEKELKHFSVKGGLNGQYTYWIRLDVAIRKCKEIIEENLKPSDNSSSKKDCYNTGCGYHRGKKKCVQPISNKDCEIRQSSPS